jgi:RNA polymerase-binding transcription factor DksA
MIPANIKTESGSFNTLLVVVLLGLFSQLFVFWSESKKDGFNTHRFFDLVFSSFIISGGISYAVYRLFEWLKIYVPSSIFLKLDQTSVLLLFFFLTSLLPVFFFSKKFKWSIFRLLDIYSVSFAIFLMFISLGHFLVSKEWVYLILLGLLILNYVFVMVHRGYKLMSGMIFSFFLFSISACALIFLKKGGSLLIASILVTIGIVNLYFRGKKTMSKSILPENFINALKRRLKIKEKNLKEQQQSLIDDDPYLQHGRATDNAETLDDVLEDTGKTITDARLSTVKESKVQVRKALEAIETGKYGKCEVCGNEIDKARLEAYPEATTCIDCATDQSQIEDIRQDEILEKNAIQ